MLLLTSCNDPMFFEGKKATEEEVNAFISNMRVILLLKFNEYPKIQRKLKNPTFTIKKEKCYRGQIIPRRQL